MKVPFSYLERQFRFSDSKEEKTLADHILDDIKAFVPTGEFTLGSKVKAFEDEFSDLIQVPHSIGVSSGTDALILSLKACGVGAGDEVITCAETFIATAGAIAGAGAIPVFVDVNDEFTIDVEKIEQAISPRTKAIIPVYFTGNCPDMLRILEIAKKYNLYVVEDSCCAIDADIRGKKAGSFGITGTFSFHPLKNLNVWSDGGMITTHSDEVAKKLRLLRNHGLINRDEVECFGLNNRLDSLQAVIALRMIKTVSQFTDRRIETAQYIDRFFQEELSDYLEVPYRNPDYRHVYHLYMVRAQDRDGLLSYCNQRGVEAKVHYPIPLPYQNCCRDLGYKKGRFPKTERDCRSVITFPCHSYLRKDEIDYMLEIIKGFYHDKSSIRQLSQAACCN